LIERATTKAQGSPKPSPSPVIGY